ncbi:MAG: hypothetical protein LBI33_06575 [Propionibacteriaceae bacterium]|jgi:hypothetical protein|nr:hypothetical protein [Propionibacteriaceae bacterium]
MIRFRTLVGLLPLVVALSACAASSQTWSAPGESDIVAVAGPWSCHEESVLFLPYDGARYVSDPKGVTPAKEYGTVPALPGDATDTGFRAGSRELWVAGDVGAVFVVDGTTVTRWPRADFGCA